MIEGSTESALSNKGLGITAQKCLYKRVIVPMALHGEKVLGMSTMGNAEGRKVNVLQMKCLRSLVGLTRMDRVRNEKVQGRAGIERELASRADQRVLRWIMHMERMDENHMARGVLMAEVSRGRVLGRPRLG